MANLDCILIRHGEPDCAADIYLGHTDPILSELGHQQCEDTSRWCAEQWPDFRAQRIYTSELQRAIHSAETVSKEFPVEISQTEQLNEVFFGDWEGLPFSEVEKAFPGALAQWLGDPLNKPAPGGEDFYMLAQRIDAFIASAPLSPCIIVAHYCSLAVLAARLLNVPLTHADRLALQRGQCARIKDGHLMVWGMPTHA